jgi:hypothetical protein
MGTNYYLHPRADCECCGRPFEPLHIGKSSRGWCFSLHVVPEEGINSLDDWRKHWNQPGAVIRDEYGDTVPIEKMESSITKRGRSGPDASWDRFGSGSPFSRYVNEEHFHFHNNSERGPNFLLRHKVDGRHCIGHGPGTYDYIVGEFS